MTELASVVEVVDFYWSDSVNECHFSLYVRVLCLDVWDTAVSQGA